MSSNELNKLAAGTYDRRVRELASDLADKVEAGEISELEANEWLVRCQDRWTDSPWG
jgi:hypothetical protein